MRGGCERALVVLAAASGPADQRSAVFPKRRCPAMQPLYVAQCGSPSPLLARRPPRDRLPRSARWLRTIALATWESSRSDGLASRRAIGFASGGRGGRRVSTPRIGDRRNSCGRTVETRLRAGADTPIEIACVAAFVR